MFENIIACMSVIIMAFSIVLIFTGILRWVGSKEKRRTRLNILGWASFAGITFLLLIKYYPKLAENLANDNSDATKALIELFKHIIKYIIIGSSVSCITVVAIGVFLIVVFGIWSLYCAITTLLTGEENELKNKVDQKCNILLTSLKSPVFVLLLTATAIVAFFTTPLLVGDSESGSLLACWKSGINNIYNTLSYEEATNDTSNSKSDNTDGVEPENIINKSTIDNTNSGKIVDTSKTTKETSINLALPYYVLIFILVVGIGYIAANILHNIISKTFSTSKPLGFLDEYSTSIGLLGFGIALLFAMSDRGGHATDKVQKLVEAMLIVVIATTLLILTLEIVRLLIDMRVTLIRNQARYLFISVVGQGVVLIHQLFFFLYAVIGNALTDTSMTGDAGEQKMQKIFKAIEQKVFTGIENELNGLTDGPARSIESRQFKPFKKHRISKDGDLK